MRRLRSISGSRRAGQTVTVSMPESVRRTVPRSVSITPARSMPVVGRSGGRRWWCRGPGWCDPGAGSGTRI